MYKIELTGKAAKFYQRADTITTRRLNLAFEKLSKNPFGHHNIKRLSRELAGSLRLKMGNIRIIYSVDNKNRIIYIEVIGWRGDVYKR